MSEQQPSSAATIDEMEAVMREIEMGDKEPVAPLVTPVAPATTVASVVAPAKVPEVLAKVAPHNPIKAYVDAERIKEDVAIDPDDLTNACIEQASKFVYYGQQKALASVQAEKMKAAFEILEANLYEQHREKLEAEADAEAARLAADETLDKKTREKGPKKITEGMVTAAVKSDKKWWAAKQRLINAQGIVDLAKIATQAYEQRKDMLVTLGADQRTERQGDLRILEKKAVEDRMMSQIRKVSGQ